MEQVNAVSQKDNAIAPKSLAEKCQYAATLARNVEEWLTQLQVGLEADLPPHLVALTYMGIKYRTDHSLQMLRTEMAKLAALLSKLGDEADAASFQAQHSHYKLMLEGVIDIAQNWPTEAQEFGLDAELFDGVEEFKQKGQREMTVLVEALDALCV